jgi:Flavin reductase like domain
MQAFEANDLADIGFPESGAAVSFRLLQDAVVPRPVYLISTISKAGVGNVAPYSYISPAATTPTSFVLSILRRDDGSEKDTLINLRASGELVINAVTEPIVHAANACAESLAPHKASLSSQALRPCFSHLVRLTSRSRRCGSNAGWSARYRWAAKVRAEHHS